MKLTKNELLLIIYAISQTRVCKRYKYLSAFEISALNTKLLEELEKQSNEQTQSEE